MANIGYKSEKHVMYLPNIIGASLFSLSLFMLSRVTTISEKAGRLSAHIFNRKKKTTIETLFHLFRYQRQSLCIITCSHSYIFEFMGVSLHT